MMAVQMTLGTFKKNCLFKNFQFIVIVSERGAATTYGASLKNSRSFSN